MISDKVLIEQAKKGCKSSFDELTLRYYSKVTDLMAINLYDRDLIKDLTQEVFINAYRGISRFEFRSSFSTWLYRIAINVMRNHFRKQKKRVEVMDVDPACIDMLTGKYRHRNYTTPENEYFCYELTQEVINTLGDMSYETFASIAQREFGGCSYETIAENLDCNIGTIRSRIFRARAALFENIKPFIIR